MLEILLLYEIPDVNLSDLFWIIWNFFIWVFDDNDNGYEGNSKMGRINILNKVNFTLLGADVNLRSLANVLLALFNVVVLWVLDLRVLSMR